MKITQLVVLISIFCCQACSTITPKDLEGVWMRDEDTGWGVITFKGDSVQITNMLGEHKTEAYQIENRNHITILHSEKEVNVPTAQLSLDGDLLDWDIFVEGEYIFNRNENLILHLHRSEFKYFLDDHLSQCNMELYTSIHTKQIANNIRGQTIDIHVYKQNGQPHYALNGEEIDYNALVYTIDDLLQGDVSDPKTCLFIDQSISVHVVLKLEEVLARFQIPVVYYITRSAHPKPYDEMSQPTDERHLLRKGLKKRLHISSNAFTVMMGADDKVIDTIQQVVMENGQLYIPNLAIDIDPLDYLQIQKTLYGANLQWEVTMSDNTFGEYLACSEELYALVEELRVATAIEKYGVEKWRKMQKEHKIISPFPFRVRSSLSKTD